jgi:hypothetical protein
VRIQFPEGSSPEQVAAMTDLVMSKLGIAARPASAKDQELTYLRRMAWVRRLEGFASESGGGVGLSYAAEPTGSTQDKIDFWLKKFAEPIQGDWKKSPTMGYDPRYEIERTAAFAPKMSGGNPVYKTNPDGSKKPNPHYQPIMQANGETQIDFRRFDITDEEIQSYRDKGLKLRHDIRGHPEEVVLSSCLLSTENRTHSGIGYGGQSSPQDVVSGGANTIYTRLGTQDSHISLDPGALAFTSAYGNSYHDAWGNIVPYHGSFSHSRTHSIQERVVSEQVSHAGSAETYAGATVDLVKWMIHFDDSRVTKAWREKTAKEFIKQGIHTMGNGKPTAEVFGVIL